MTGEARRYCEIIERSDSFDRVAFVAGIGDALLAVVAAVFAIGEQRGHSDGANPDSISHEEWRPVYQRIGALLGELNDYWTSEPRADEPLIGALYNLELSDDLADIWRDLAEGLRALDAGDSEANVLWHWKFTFEIHWGRHASEALRVLTQLRLSTP